MKLTPRLSDGGQHVKFINGDGILPAYNGEYRTENKWEEEGGGGRKG